jgi:two-component system LytT family sensor kinase
MKIFVNLIQDKVGWNYIRYVLHFFFWFVIYVCFIYLKKPLLGLSNTETAILVVKDLIVIAIIFYFLTYYVVPEILLKKKFVLLIISLVAIYYFYATMLYLDFKFTSHFFDIPGRGYQAYSKRITSSGIIGIIRLDHAAEILLDLSYLLSPALIVKLLVKLFDLSTQALKLQMDNLNLELAFLKAQINPHFLFNTLNNVYSLALHKSDKTADVILKLSDLMRYTLYESNTPQVSMSEEMKFFSNYIELERIRHSSKVTIALNIEGEYDHLSIAPLIIFPYMENAFKHGINAAIGNSWVNIKFKIYDNNMLNVVISNSKFGVKKSVKPFGGIGIANTKKRLNILYAKEHWLTIQETEAVFTVDITIKLTAAVNNDK